MNDLAKKVVDSLAAKHLTIGSIESITGGLFASSITRVAGSSKVFLGSAVTYSNDMKTALIGVSADIIKNYGVVSEPVAFQMAKLGRVKLGVDVAVSFTGNAGPEVIDDLEVGLVYIGVSTKEDTDVYREVFEGTREEIQNQAVNFALESVLKHI